MKYKPAVDKTALEMTIRRAYGFRVHALTRVPHGFVGQHYIAGCENGEQYFVTLLGDSRAARLSSASLDFTLALTRRLVDRGLFRPLAAPLYTLAGSLKSAFQGQTLVIYDAIAGRTLMDAYPYTPGTLARLARLTATLHRCTGRLEIEIPVVEQFSLPFERDLLDGLSDLGKVTSRDRRGKRTLKELLRPQRENILGLLSHLHQLAETAQALRPPMVLCHTDITPLNIIQTPGDELVLVDWDGAMLAPAEADLCLFTGEGFPVFLGEYWREAGMPHLNGELLAFYMLRRNLVDLTDWIVTILHENRTDEEDQNDLNGVLEDCIPAWSTFDRATGLVRKQLKAIPT